MWHIGRPADQQREGCAQVTDMSYHHSRGITCAAFCHGPHDESARHRDFKGWNVPGYSARDSLAQGEK
jgi:Bacterial protein of unknown function (DUF899)